MYNDIINLWSEDSDFNVVRTWLVGGSDGQTYPILDRFLPRIKIDEEKYDFDLCDIESDIDDIIGWKHDYKLDDPDLTSRAWTIVNGLDAFVEKVNANPGKYFSLAKIAEAQSKTCGKCVHCVACKRNKPDFDMNGYCETFDSAKK